MNLQEKETVDVEVKFKATITKDFLEEFNKIVDHKIDCLIDLNEFPEIKSVYDANLNIVATKPDDNCHRSEDLVNFYDSKERVVKCHRSFSNGNYQETINIYTDNHPHEEEPIANCTLYSSPKDPRSKFFIRNNDTNKVEYSCYGNTITKYLYNVTVEEALQFVDNNDKLKKVIDDLKAIYISGDFIINELQLYYNNVFVNFENVFDFDYDEENHSSVLIHGYQENIEEYIKNISPDAGIIINAKSRYFLPLNRYLLKIPQTDTVDFKSINFKDIKVNIKLSRFNNDDFVICNITDVNTGTKVSINKDDVTYCFKDKYLDNTTHSFSYTEGVYSDITVLYRKIVDYSKEIYKISPKFKGETSCTSDILYQLDNNEFKFLKSLQTQFNIKKDVSKRFEEFLSVITTCATKIDDPVKHTSSYKMMTIYDLEGNLVFRSSNVTMNPDDSLTFDIMQVISDPVDIDQQDYTVEIEYGTSSQYDRLVTKMHSSKNSPSKLTETVTYKNGNMISSKRFRNGKIWMEVVSKYKDDKLIRSEMLYYDELITQNDF